LAFAFWEIKIIFLLLVFLPNLLKSFREFKEVEENLFVILLPIEVFVFLIPSSLLLLELL